MKSCNRLRGLEMPLRTTERGRSVAARWITALTLTAAMAASSGCLRDIAMGQMADALSGANGAFMKDDDPELIRDAVPFSLKLVDFTLEEKPKHKGLLTTAASGYCMYAYAFVMADAERIEMEDIDKAERLRARARKLFTRAIDYGLRGLELDHPGFSGMLREDPLMAMCTIKNADDVPLLYWTGVAWGSLISVSKDRPDLIAEQPIAEALLDRALALDEGFEDGALHVAMMMVELSRKGGTADPEQRARLHFQRAVDLSGGLLAAPYVVMAEEIAVKHQDKDAFRSLLKKALEIDVDERPEWRLQNVIMQERARWLLDREDDIFVRTRMPAERESLRSRAAPVEMLPAPAQTPTVFEAGDDHAAHVEAANNETAVALRF